MYTYNIEHSPAYASLRVKLAANQSLIVESGSMAAMDSHITLKSNMRGGMMKSLGRMLGGESLFLSEFTATGKNGEILISPGVPGDLCHYKCQTDRALFIQSSGFVAADPNITIDTKFQGFKGFFSGESLFLIKASGAGDIWFSSYGAIIEIPVNGSYIVDTGYIVAFEDSLNYKVEMLGGLSFKSLKTSIFGGEGLVCRFSGQGKLWIQTRHLGPLINFLHAFRPVKSD
jgi:uncharacterized protein (TIGR00266 family)